MRDLFKLSLSGRVAYASAKIRTGETKWASLSETEKRIAAKREEKRLHVIAVEAAEKAIKNELAPTAGTVEAGQVINRCEANTHDRFNQ